MDHRSRLCRRSAGQVHHAQPRMMKADRLTTLLGIGGAFVGDCDRYGLLGMNRLLDGLLGSIVSATLGALVILWAYNKWFKK